MFADYIPILNNMLKYIHLTYLFYVRLYLQIRLKNDVFNLSRFQY